MMSLTVTFDRIEQLLSTHAGCRLPESRAVPAAVAMIFRDDNSGPEILFIERATCAGDPWSGNIGFPGGKVETADVSPRFAAERETREELGIDLDEATFLGFLAEIAGAHLPVRVSCFVYRLDSIPQFRFSDEVVDAFWVPLETLLDRQRHCAIPIPFAAETVPRPGFRLPQEEKPFLWGLTYRLVRELLLLLSWKDPLSPSDTPGCAAPGTSG